MAYFLLDAIGIPQSGQGRTREADLLLCNRLGGEPIVTSLFNRKSLSPPLEPLFSSARASLLWNANLAVDAGWRSTDGRPLHFDGGHSPTVSALGSQWTVVDRRHLVARRSAHGSSTSRVRAGRDRLWEGGRVDG